MTYFIAWVYNSLLGIFLALMCNGVTDPKKRFVSLVLSFMTIMISTAMTITRLELKIN